MAWVRIDENFAQHPKVVRAGPLGMAMHIAALCYSNRHLTDGFVLKQIVKHLLDLDGLSMRGNLDADWSMIAEDLVAAGLWEEAPGGWHIHDYLDFQPSKSDIDKKKQAGSKGGKAKGTHFHKAHSQAQNENVLKQNAESRLSETPSKNAIPAQADTDTVPVKEKPSLRSGKKGSRLSASWSPTAEDTTYAKDCGLSQSQIDSEAANFRDYWIAKAGKDGVKLDWPATWRTWVRRYCERRGIGPPARGNGHAPHGYGPDGLPIDWEARTASYERTGEWQDWWGDRREVPDEFRPRFEAKDAELPL